MQTVRASPDFNEWRANARRLLQCGVAPTDVHWIDSTDSEQSLLLFEDDSARAAPSPLKTVAVPPAFLTQARSCVLHRDPDRWAILYRLLWRLTHGEPHLLEIGSDEDVHRLHIYEKAVRRDCHKMTAFVRFREIKTEQGSHFVAWYQPDHYIVERTAPFFVERFNTMDWSILTPDRCAHFVGGELSFSIGESKPLPADDAMESLWRTYYASIFNPARLKIKAMKKELPVRFWENLPEADLIPALIENATRRATAMISDQPEIVPTASAFLPETHSLPALRNAAHHCEGCELYKPATQTVFGEGRADASIFFIGEQPGDQEDLAGKPFVGPAGKLFDQALAEVGIDRAETYVTNAVKHFRFEQRGKRRLHSKPSARHIHACKPWLNAEIGIVKPAILVCLGATAAQALLGPAFKITNQRGTLQQSAHNIPAIATYHPSALLRVSDRTRYDVMWSELVSDLAKAKQYAGEQRRD